MRIETTDKYEFVLKEVYNGVTLETNSGEKLSICMRDSGFEFTYEGSQYSAQNGFVRKVETAQIINYENDPGEVPG